MRKYMGYYVRKGMAVATAVTVLATSVPMGNFVVRAEVQEGLILDEDEGYQEDEDEDENKEQDDRGSKAGQGANGNAGVTTPSDATPQATSSNAGVAVTNLMGTRAGQKCGENAYWAFDETTGTLTISGSGAMEDYEYSGAAPWTDKRENVKTVIIEDGITHIGESAFTQYDSLTKITMGKDVETIGKWAFNKCKNLGELTLGKGVKEIEYSAFAYCEKLKTVKLNDQLTTIGDSAFEWCKALEDIAWNNGLKSIGKSAFCHCHSLSELQFGTGLKVLGEAAFEECENLKIVRFSDSVETIGIGAFAWCKKLKAVSFGTGLKTIRDYAFSTCNLETVTLEDGVKSIGKYAFAGNRYLTKVTIKADTAPTIGDYAFIEAEFVKNNTRGIIVPAGRFGEYSYVWSEYRDYIQTGTFGKCGEKVNWEYNELFGVLAIRGEGKMSSLDSASAYPWHEYRDQIEWIVIEDGVTSIGNYAFSSCYRLKTVTLGNGVKTIGKEAFDMCGELTSVTFGKNLEVIGDSAFYMCPNLKCVELKDQVKTIGDYAFNGCNELSSVTLGTGVERIGDGAFGFCIKLETITLGAALQSIGSEAFGYCGDLTTVTILAKEIPQGGVDMFADTKLSQDGIYVPYNSLSEYQERWQAYREYIKGISSGTCGEQVAWTYDAETKILTISGVGAMDDYSLQTGIAPWAKIPFQTLVIEDGVTNVGNRAFECCDHLKTVILGDGVKTIGQEAFYMCDELNHVTWGTGLEQIGDRAFEECIGLEHIQLQDQVKMIGNDAFSGCRGLFSVTIGNGIQSIGTKAFSGCNKLYLVNMGEHIPTIGTNVFDRTYFVANRKKGIVVPNECVKEYKKAWNEWTRYITERDPVEEEGESGVRVNGGVVYLPSDLPSDVEIGNWTQTAEGSWTFTSFGKISNLNSASHGGAGGSGSGGGAGSLAKGWVAAYNPYATGGQDSYDWFYFDANGVMVTGWFTDTDGNIYYLNPESDGRRGAMLVGWQWIDRDGDGIKEKYYFNEESDGTRGKLIQ